MQTKPSTLISIIIPAKNEGNNVRSTLGSLLEAKTAYPFEVIVVDDDSDDGCCDFLSSDQKPENVRLISTDGVGAANARNVGAEFSNGELLIFCDAHLFFEDYWLDRLIAPILGGQADATSPGIAPTNAPDVVGYGQTLDENLQVKWHGRLQDEPFETAILPGGCLAVSREAFFHVCGFEKGFQVWGYEDVEFSIKLWLFGYCCMVVPEVVILHLFREAHPYQVTCSHVDYNLLRMAYIHFNDQRIDRCRQLIVHSNRDSIDLMLVQDGIMEQRDIYFSNRRYDDDWFMQKFVINF